jgi:ribosomal protein L24E
MVLKTTLCRFSGLRIYPGRGILFIRVDNQQYLFLNKKCKSLYHNRLRPAKLAWTTTYRCRGWAGPAPGLKGDRGQGATGGAAAALGQLQHRGSGARLSSTEGCLAAGGTPGSPAAAAAATEQQQQQGGGRCCSRAALVAMR